MKVVQIDLRTTRIKQKNQPQKNQPLKNQPLKNVEQFVNNVAEQITLIGSATMTPRKRYTVSPDSD